MYLPVWCINELINEVNQNCSQLVLGWVTEFWGRYGQNHRDLDDYLNGDPVTI